MADWDDDDFELPDDQIPGNDAVEWEDEEEEEPEPEVKHGDAPKLSKEKAAKAQSIKEAKRRAEIESALQEGETDAERRLRERQDVEEADHELTNELFAGTGQETVVVQGVEGYALKNLKDYVTLAHDVADRFETVKAKSNFQGKFVKEVLKKIEGKLSIEDCDEIIGILAAAKLAKEKAKKQPTAKKIPTSGSKKPKAKTKKEIQAEKEAHDDLFGGFVENEYQHFEEEYDDFM